MLFKVEESYSGRVGTAVVLGVRVNWEMAPKLLGLDGGASEHTGIKFVVACGLRVHKIINFKYGYLQTVLKGH